MTDSTTIHYEYQDGSGWRKRAEWTFAGPCSPEQDRCIMATMNADGFFVPSAVGIPMLVSTFSWDDEIDHPLHSITRIESDGRTTDDDRTADDIVQAFEKADWDRSAYEFEMETA